MVLLSTSMYLMRDMTIRVQNVCTIQKIESFTQLIKAVISTELINLLSVVWCKTLLGQVLSLSLQDSINS